MSVEDIHVAQNGMIWIATRGGVCTFDGESFDRFDDVDQKPLAAKRIEERSNGDIIIDAGKSLFVFDGATFTEYQYPKDYKSTTYSNMVVDWDDNIWIQNRKTDELFLFQQDSLFRASEVFEHPFFSQSEFIIPDTINKCYYGIQNGKEIVKYCDGNIELVHQAVSGISMWKNFQVSNNPYGFRFKDVDIKGHYSFFEFSSGKTYSLNPYSDDVADLSKKNIKIDIHDGSKNKLWVSEEGECIQLLEGIQNRYNHFFCYESIGDAHYIGTGKGLLKITKSPFNIFPEEEHHSINFIRDVGGEIYFGSYGDGLISLSKDKIDYVPKSGKNGRVFHRRNYYHPSIIGKDSMIVPTEHGIFLLHENVSTYMFPKFDDNPKPTLFTYYDEARELIIVSMCPEVYILNKQFEVVKVLDEELIKHRCMLTTSKDDKGDYWFGGSGGVSKYNFEKDEVTNYSVADGSFPISGAICSLKDDYDNLWFGSRDGLCIYNKEQQVFEKVEQLKNYSISSLIQTGSKQYFLNTTNGLMMADLSDYGADKEVEHSIYTKTNGFDALEPGQNGLYQDNNGLVWTTSSTNVISFDPEKLKYQARSVTPYIKTINGHRISNSHPLAIEQGENSLKVNYGNVGTESRELILYRLRLNKKEWSQWTKETSKEYQRLGSGSYTIHVQAKPAYENDTCALTASAEAQVSLSFNKEPYFNTLIQSLLFIVTGIFLWLYQRNKNEKAINEVLKERNDLLSEKNEGLLTEKEKLSRLNQVLSSNLASIKASSKKQKSEKIEVSSFDKSYSINPQDILYLKSDKKITKINLLDKPAIWSNHSLKHNYEMLKERDFLQIQRSTVINIAHIEWINTNTLKMTDGEVHQIGRAYKTQLKSHIEGMGR